MCNSRTIVATFCAAVTMLTFNIVWSQQKTFLLQENFEGNWRQNWKIQGGTWQVGVPTSGPGKAFQDDSCAATVLAGNYSEGVNAIFFTKDSILIPLNAVNPQLRFWHWFSISAGDYGQVQVKPAGGNWEPISISYGGVSSGAWTKPSLDLSAYAGKTIQIGFYFQSRDVTGFDDTSWGWYIDNVEIVTGNLVFNNPENFENGIGDWYVDNGTWEVGAGKGNNGYLSPSSGATRLDGNYAEGVDSRLISPPFVVPNASENPRLRFWHYFSISSGDYGQVQVKPAGGNWEPISISYGGVSSGAWTKPSLDLSAYAGKTIQIGFYFQSRDVTGFDDTSWGWYIDNVEIVTGNLVFNNPENFENGIGDWYVDNGTWEVGAGKGNNGYLSPSSGATKLDGNYAEGVDSRLISPPFVVPNASENPRLRFWHYFSIGAGDQGTVEIKVEGGAWQTILGPFTGTSEGKWRHPFYDLSPYAGSTVQIAFHFQSRDVTGFDDTGAGWYIDDVISQALPILPPAEISVHLTGTTPVPGREFEAVALIENIGDVGSSATALAFLGPWQRFMRSQPSPDKISEVALPFPIPEAPRDTATVLQWDISNILPGEIINMSFKVRLNNQYPLGQEHKLAMCIIKDPKDCQKYLDVACYNDCLKKEAEVCRNAPPLLRTPCWNQLEFRCEQKCLKCVKEMEAIFGINSLINIEQNASSECDDWDDITRGPVDPNEKLVAPGRFIKPAQTIIYPIHFENIGNIEARDIFITDILDPNLDISTLKFLTTDSASFDAGTRTVKWTLLNRNLPPGETDNVLLSIKPLPNLSAGTKIRNKADIQFEVFNPITTNEVENIIDTAPPTSKMKPLPPEVSTLEFPISWSGADSIGEVDFYSVFVSVNNGVFTRFIDKTSNTTATFHGAPGKTYGFATIAYDKAGNKETKEPEAEAVTHIAETTSVDSTKSQSKLPTEYALLQNYPNPFNPVTEIQYQLPLAGNVELIVYNILGQKVRTLVNKTQLPGFYTIQWDGKNDAGSFVTSGVYLFQLKTKGFAKVKKMLIVR